MNAYIIGIFLLLVSSPGNCTESTINRIKHIKTKYRGSLGFVSATALIGVPLYTLIKERNKERNEHESFKRQAIPYITRSLVYVFETEAYKKFRATGSNRGFALTEDPRLAYRRLVDENIDLYGGEEPVQIELLEKTYELQVRDNLSKITYFPKAEKLSSGRNEIWGVKASTVLPQTNDISPQVEVDSRPDSIEVKSLRHWPGGFHTYKIQPPYIYPRITFRPLPPEKFYAQPLQRCVTFFNHKSAATPGLRGTLSANVKCYKKHSLEEEAEEATLDVDVEANLDKPAETS